MVTEDGGWRISNKTPTPCLLRAFSLSFFPFLLHPQPEVRNPSFNQTSLKTQNTKQKEKEKARKFKHDARELRTYNQIPKKPMSRQRRNPLEPLIRMDEVREAELVGYAVEEVGG